MQVRKRNGAFESVELSKIEVSLKRYCSDLPNIDVYRIASKTVGGLVDGVTTLELDMLSVRTAKDLIIDDPVYAKVAARILANVIQKEVGGLDIQSFSQSIELGYQQGLISDATHALMLSNKRKLNAAIKNERDWNMEYHGLQTVYDRYLLKHPTAVRPSGGGDRMRAVIETPQYFFMRVACGLANDASEAIEMYNLLSSLEYMCSTPTLFNSGTTHSQMSSCYLQDSPLDSLEGLYKTYSDTALLSKFAGGIGLSLSRIRGRDSLIKGTNGKSNGIVPWAHTLSASVAGVNQCLHPDTKVYTPVGMKPIKTLTTEDRVLGISGYYRPVQEVLQYEASTERMLEIKVRHGATPIRITDGHPVYAICGVKVGESYGDIEQDLNRGVFRSSFTEAKHLRVGDLVGTPIPQPQPVVDVIEFSDNDGSESVIRYDGGIPQVTKSHWLIWGGMLWSRIKQISEVEMPSEVYDLRVEFDETYAVEGALVHNGGKRKGAAAIYLETHHPDIMQFLELKDNSGEREQRAYNLNLANWVSDLFMKRVKTDGIWSLFDPVIAPELVDLYGDAYEKRYLELESAGKYTEQIPARKIYARMMRTLAETGNGWITFKDTCNRRGNQVNDEAGTMIHLSNLCTEILEVTSSGKKTQISRETMNSMSAQDLIDDSLNVVGFDRKTNQFEVIEGAEVSVCLAAGTAILTKNGYLPIEMCDGKDVYVPFVDDNTRVAAPRYITAKLINNGVRATSEIVLDDGKTLHATENHKFLIRVGRKYSRTSGFAQDTYTWKTVADLTVGDKIARPLTPAMENITYDKEYAATVKAIHPFGMVNVYDLYVPDAHHFIANGMVSHNCNLGSINLGRGYVKHGKLDKDKLRKNVAIAMKYLDRVINRNFYPIPEAESSNMRWRPVGLGLMGLADFFMQLRIPYDSEQATQLSAEIQEEIYYQALKTSCELAKELGSHRDFSLTRAAAGELQFDLAGVIPSDVERWDALKAEISNRGLRNSLLIAIAPTATISHICGVEEAIEPIKSNLLKRETLSGEFVAVNKYLVEDLRKLGRWNAETINQLKVDEGSITNILGLPADLYANYKTVWEMSMKSLIAHAVARGAYIDQSHSLNMFIDLKKYPEDKRIGVLSSLYMHAWESGIKTTYYFRSRAATRIQQTTIDRATIADATVEMAPETPDVCETCT